MVKLMNQIKSIVIIDQTSVFGFADEIFCHITEVYRHGRVRHCLHSIEIPSQVQEYNYAVDSNKCESFFEFLEEEIRLDEWNNDYSVEVCYGYYWTMFIYHSDDTVKRVRGTVEPPPKGQEVEEALLKLVNFKVKPWIF